MTMAAGPAAAPPARLRSAVQFALLAGPLLSMLDSSIVNVAAEPIARSLHASLATVQWAVSGYLLALGTGLAATSYLARRFGTRAVYRASMIAFTVASGSCAAATGTAMLLASRVVQGLVAAPLVPLAMSMLLGRGQDQGKPAARSVSALAGMMLFLGPALGPTVGGALIGAAGWRWIFLINVPVGAAAALATGRIPAALAPGRAQATRFDLPGLVLLAAGMALVLLGASQGAQAGWAVPRTWLPLLGGLALLAGYGRWAAGREHPALDLGLARHRGPVLALALCALASVVTFAAIFLLPVFVQSVQGRSALAAGLAMLPQGVVTGISTALGQRVLTRVSVRVTVLAGFSILTVTSLGLLAIGARTPLAVTAAVLAGRSASIGLVIAPLLTVLTQPLRPAQLGDASTLFSICQRIAGSFGIGLLAALFAVQARAHGPVTALHVTGGVVAVISAAGILAAPLLPATRNVALGAAGPPAGPRQATAG